MKKASPFLCVVFLLITLLSASVWEGSAAISEDLPETGFYIATNSYPINTVVDVTNLENDKIIRLLVYSRLENSGFLALLSKDAADALGIKNSSLGRIRMSESVDPVAFSRFAEGRILVDGSLFVPAIAPPGNVQTPKSSASGNERQEGGERIVDLPDVLPVQEKGVSISETERALIPSETELVQLPAEEIPIEEKSSAAELTLVPSTERPPETEIIPDPADFTASISPIEEKTAPSQTKSILIEPPVSFVTEAAEPVAPVETVLSVAPFTTYHTGSVPLIYSLEVGKYYLQLASYSRPEYAQYEISRIDSKLPVAIMNAEVAGKSVYRVLVGPVTLGESGALLQRFKGSHKDAFVWLGR